MSNKTWRCPLTPMECILFPKEITISIENMFSAIQAFLSPFSASSSFPLRTSDFFFFGIFRGLIMSMFVLIRYLHGYRPSHFSWCHQFWKLIELMLFSAQRYVILLTCSYHQECHSSTIFIAARNFAKPAPLFSKQTLSSLSSLNGSNFYLLFIYLFIYFNLIYLLLSLEVPSLFTFLPLSLQSLSQ